MRFATPLGILFFMVSLLEIIFYLWNPPANSPGSTAVSIDAGHPAIDTLTLGIYDHNVTGISDVTGGNEIIAGTPFPNPASGNISIPLTVLKKVSLQASLFSMQSNPLTETRREFGPGKYSLTLDLEAFLPECIFYL